MMFTSVEFAMISIWNLQKRKKTRFSVMVVHIWFHFICVGITTAPDSFFVMIVCDPNSVY